MGHVNEMGKYVDNLEWTMFGYECLDMSFKCGLDSMYVYLNGLHLQIKKTFFTTKTTETSSFLY